MNIRWSKTRLRVTAGLVAGSAGLALVSGLGPARALLPLASARGADGEQHAREVGDDRGDDDAPTRAPGTTAATRPGATRMVDAAGAGTVAVALAGGRLAVVDVSPAAGWRAEIEQAAGREVEVDFRRGAERVRVHLEVEDGTIRERLRIRDDVTGTDVRVENGVIVRAEGPGADDEGRGPGPDPGPGANAGPGGDDARLDDAGVDVDVDGDDRGDHHGGVTSSGPGGGGDDDPAGDGHGGGGPS